MTRRHDRPPAGRHRLRVPPDVAAFPRVDGLVSEHLDVGGFVDRAAAFIRSWGATEAPYTIAHVLGLWRDAERDLDTATPGSDVWLVASERFIAARSEYHRLFDVAFGDADGLRRLG
jgi:hypothetical protein